MITLDDEMIEQVEICLMALETSIELAHRQQTIEVLFIELMRSNFTKQQHKVWDLAFQIYNNNNEHKLSRNCTPCYFKVYKWLQSFFEQKRL